jgi:DNA-binding transcriptional MocR family regulator
LDAPHLYGGDVIYPPLLEHAKAEFAGDGIDPAARFLVASGAMDAIEKILSVHLDPGDHVLVEDPTYAELLDLLRVLRLVPVGVSCDDHGPDPEMFAAALPGVRAAVLTPRSQNPTGAELTGDRARVLRTALHAHPSVILVENDHSAQVAAATYQSVSGVTDHWAVVRSASKTLSPDLRLSIISADEKTVDLVESRQLVGAGWVSHILQTIAYRLYSQSSSTELFARAHNTYAHRRNMLMSALSMHDIESRGASGINVYVQVPEEGTIAQSLLLKGWAVRTGEGYRVASTTPFIRVTTSTLTDAEAEQFASDLHTSLKSRRRRQS